MIITRCNSCGKLFHRTDACFYCGNANDFTEVDNPLNIHENIKDEYYRLALLIEQERFDEAITLSDSVLEWMPFSSSVFWMRILAKNHARNDETLIRNGFSFETSSDYYNAMLYACDAEKQVYGSVITKIIGLREALIRYITEHEYTEKLETGIIGVHEQYIVDLDAYRRSLFDLWNQLKNTECRILELEKDCRLLTHEYKETLLGAKSDSAAIGNTISKIEECTIDELHNYQTKLGKMLYQSEQAKATVNSMRNSHPWMQTYQSLVAERDNIISKIQAETDLLRDLENRIRITVDKIIEIEARHGEARAIVNQWDFSNVLDIIDYNQLCAAFAEVGIR